MEAPSLNLLAILSILGAAQALLLALALASLKRGNQTVNRVLAALAVTTSITIIGSILNSTRYILLFPQVAQLHSPFNFLIPPLIYLYIKALISRESGFGKRTLRHFVPALACLLYYLPLYFRSREGKLAYMLAAFQNYPPLEWRIRSILIFSQSVFYLSLTIYLVVTHSRKLGKQASLVEKSNLFWAKSFIFVVLLCWAVATLRFFFAYDARAWTMLIVPLSLSVWMYVMGYVTLRQAGAVIGAVDDVPPSKKYEKSTLTPERAEEYLKRITRLMETEKPYREGDLTLQKLATGLSISPHHLSQIINERLNQNFFDFVNAHRIEEAKRMLVDPGKKHYSILAIAEEVGFNSKSAFNTAFKKHASMTPSEFRKSSNGDGAH
ncbi:MAG: helix-turn-helix domain-containing protein [Pyrinomonadaceae bacterium]